MAPADVATALCQLTLTISQSACTRGRVDELQQENMEMKLELEKAKREFALAKSELDSSQRLLDERSTSLAIQRSLRVSLGTSLGKRATHKHLT